LRGATEIALAVGGGINRHKMAEYFNLYITVTSFTRKAVEIAADAAIEHLCRAHQLAC
jgi:hypothetical protein